MPLRARFLMLAVVLAATVSLGAAASASAAPGDIGFTDHGYAPLGGSPTGSKPESKLWFNDGRWWSTMFTGTEWHIYSLNSGTGAWSDTGTLTDVRDSTRADTLWDGSANKLYLASHVFTTSGGATTAANAGRLFRYSYNTATDTYTLDAGFPVQINSARSETLVIDKDSTGVLWATWTAGSQVFVNHSTGGDGATWGTTPYVVPGAANLSSDDISSLVRYGGNKIGVMWSNQATNQFLFATHTDGTGDTAASWSTVAVPTGASSDDHVNLKAGDDGRVYAAVKTSETSSSRPMIQLLVRATNGSWSAHTYGVPNLHTRPIVQLDEQNDIVHVLATCPQPPSTNGQSGGDICDKSTPMSSISFAPGAGTAIIRDADSAEMNDPTSTKQNLNSTTGLVVMANNATTKVYWHAQLSLGGSIPTPVTANFNGSPTSGTAPLAVTFNDTSTGGPTSWSWSFGDGQTSPAQNPVHTYTTPGTYTVTLTASNASSSDGETKVGYITVNPSGGGGGGTTAFTAVADAHVRDTSATTNFGTATTLRVRTDPAGDDYRTLLKFNVAGITGPVTDAKLRLFVTDASPDGGRIYAVSNSWTETGVNWNNKPVIGPSPVGSIGTTPAVNNWVEVPIDLSAISGDGTYSFELVNSTTNSAIYTSREGTNKPQLLITAGTGGSPPPVTASFTGDPTSGTAPLPVTFSDSSTGNPTSWSWNFGDGQTSTAQNPVHTYANPGTYTVSLTASNGTTSDTETLTNYITVNPAGGGGGGTTAFPAVADAHVRDTAPTSNYGTLTTLRVRTDAAGDDYRTLLKFTVAGLSGTITTAKLRLWVTDVSPDSGRVYAVSNSWTETGVNWNIAPSISEPPVASIGATTVVGSWVEVDVKPAITGNGTFSFELVSSSTNSAIYSSRQGTNPPELVITTS